MALLAVNVGVRLRGDSIASYPTYGDNTYGSGNYGVGLPYLAFSIAPVLATTACGDVTTTVASTSSSMSFGAASTAQTSVVGQSLNVATNAANGYTTYVSQTGAFTASGSGATIAPVSGTNASPSAWPAATEAIGYATDSSALSGTANRFRTNKWAQLETTNREVMRNAAATATSGDTNCIAFQLGISGTTTAGNYATTIRYSVVPSF